MREVYYYYLFICVLLVLAAIGYFKVAIKFKITDKPNHRSSHKLITIRGGGIVFPLAMLIQAVFSGFQYSMFMLGLILISFISFYDDLRPLSNKIRLLIHLTAVALLFTQVELFSFSPWVIFMALIFVIGTINAYNFMDGINGITGAYSLVSLLSLYFVNKELVSFMLPEWLLVPVISVLVFNFFNFRAKARCFAGDVGSVSIAFIIIFFLISIILKTGDLKYMGFLLLYGLDTVSTIILRLIRKENIFQAHRSHFYQFLANDFKIPHLTVSILYASLQGMFNLLLISIDLTWMSFVSLGILAGIFFVFIRFSLEGKRILLKVS